MRHQAEIERVMLGRIRYVFGRTEFDRVETNKINPEAKYFVVGEIMREPFYAPCPERSSFDREGREDTEPCGTGRVCGGLKSVGRDGVGLKIVSTVSGGLYKGYEMLLRTAKALKEANFDFKWTVIGCSENEPFVRMCEKYTGLHSSELGICLVGRRTAEAVAGILDGVDVYCHVSHIENSPNSVCEAMLRGLPVVAAAVGGVPSIVEDGVTGILYPDSDAGVCAAALMSLNVEPEKTAEMGVAGRRAALARHGRERVLGQLLNAYYEILSQNG